MKSVLNYIYLDIYVIYVNESIYIYLYLDIYLDFSMMNLS
jgi:hypothetical protein